MDNEQSQGEGEAEGPADSAPAPEGPAPEEPSKQLPEFPLDSEFKGGRELPEGTIRMVRDPDD